MAKFHSAVIPFPKRFSSLHSLAPVICPFQAAAELRVAMLHKLFSTLRKVEGSAAAMQQLHEVCGSASQLLSDVVVLYRNSLVQAQGRARDE
ncbi:MAG: hypothetical protein ACRERY_01490 [Pseudomonas sp.]